MRRKSEWNRRLAGVILLLALSVGLGTVWGASPAVQEILAKGRGANSQEATDLSKRLVALGPEALSEVCVMLLAPGTGDDVNARFALSGATMYVSRTGAETERKMLEGVLLDALKKASNADVKAFLIERLRFIAKDESVPALAAYLTDETLCDWSARTLVTINSDASRAALVAALPNAKGSCQMRVAQALGNLREAKALDTLSDLAKNNDKAIRKAALYALAQIADL
ncbi:MAG TPA: HEAT repeat domain-containing protein [Candidatus Sumerlaeota bacterium]|nr:HEAT repeat domain-containing protein [Candidatus Sumerlaeota bacterium]